MEYYIRAKFIKNFRKYYPDIDGSTILTVNVFSSPHCLYLKVHPHHGHECNHPTRNNGLWLFSKTATLYETSVECAEHDEEVNWRYFIRISYNDYRKYESNRKRYIEVDKDLFSYCRQHTYDRYPTELAIESRSNPLGYELAKVISTTMREDTPDDILKRRVICNITDLKSTLSVLKLKAVSADTTVENNKIAELEKVIVSQAMEIAKLKQNLN